MISRQDRKLKRRHITGKSSDKYCIKSADQLGIAFSGAVGIGLFSTSGQTIALGGPVGALLAFFFAGLVMVSVMRCLAEMVSVRPVKGAIMDYPGVFVDEALGFAVGLLYRLVRRIMLGNVALLNNGNRCANCMSVVTLTVAVSALRSTASNSSSYIREETCLEEICIQLAIHKSKRSQDDQS